MLPITKERRFQPVIAGERENEERKAAAAATAAATAATPAPFSSIFAFYLLNFNKRKCFFISFFCGGGGMCSPVFGR